MLSEEEVAARAAEQELQDRLRDVRYSGALGLMVDEAGFLVELKVRFPLAGFTLKPESLHSEFGLHQHASQCRILGASACTWLSLPSTVYALEFFIRPWDWGACACA